MELARETLELHTSSTTKPEVAEVWSPEEMQRRRKEWRSLWRRCSGATPFQHPDWLLPWSQALASGSCWAVALRREGKLLAVLPIMDYLSEEGSLRSVFMGQGISDYAGPLIDPVCGEEGFAPLLSPLLSERRERIDLEAVRAEDPLLKTSLHSLAEAAGFELQRAEQDACPCVELPAESEALLPSLPRSLRANLRRSLRRMSEAGEVRFESAETGSLDEFLEAFFALHRIRWQERGESGVLQGEEIQAFHRLSAPALLQEGLLGLHGIRFEGRLVAIVYLLQAGERAYSYLGGFDPSLSAYSPGALVLEYAMRKAIEGGARAYDLLRGRERYKYLWGARDQLTYRLIFRRSRP